VTVGACLRTQERRKDYSRARATKRSSQQNVPRQEFYLGLLSPAGSARISIFDSWPPSIVHLIASVRAVSSILFIPSESYDPGRGQIWLLRARKPRSVSFQASYHTVSPYPSFHRPVCLPAAAPYPVGEGSPAIRRTMLPNSRRLRWLSAKSNQKYRMEAKRRALDEIAARQRAADERRQKEADLQQQAAVVSQSAVVQQSAAGNLGAEKRVHLLSFRSARDLHGTDASVNAGDGSLPGLFPESTVDANVYVIIESCSTFGSTSMSLDEAPLRSGCVHST
jgi:hypothetical protein